MIFNIEDPQYLLQDTLNLSSSTSESLGIIQFKSSTQSSSESQKITKLPQKLNSIGKDIIAKQKRKYIKKKKVEAIPVEQYLLKYNGTLMFDSYTLLTCDGALRFLPSLNQISFNYLTQRVERIEQMKDLDVISIQYGKQKKFSRDPLNNILQKMCRVPGYSSPQIQNLLFKYNRLMDTFLFNLSDINEEMAREKDEELKEFIAFCYNSLADSTKDQQRPLYFYTMARLNLDTKLQEIAHIGYSKSYLDLLGIDLDSINQIFLRNKQIDLLQRYSDITLQTLSGLDSMTSSETLPQYELYESDIFTFDGFPIKINQKKKSACDIFKPKKNYGHDHEYLFTMVEIDVELQSLQQLIEYRQRISEHYQKVNIDDFLRRENSYLFEDVEYSVQSQNFIEKFYGQNLEDLEKVQEDIAEKQKECKYRQIIKQ